MAVLIEDIQTQGGQFTVQRKLYYDETANKWWVIYEDTDSDDIFYETSTDGTTWGNKTQLNTDAGATCIYPTLAGDGTYLYVYWLDDGSGDDGIHFRRITLSDSTLYPAVSDGVVVDLGSFVAVWPPTACCTPSGYAWVMVPEEGVGPWYSDDNGASWTDSAAGTAGDSDCLTIMVPLASDNVMCIHDQGGSDDHDIHYDIWTHSTTSWAGSSEFVASIWTDNSDPDLATANGATHIGSSKVLWVTPEPAPAQATTDIAVFHFDGASTWTQRNDIVTNETTDAATVGWDTTNSEAYLVYESGTDDDVYYRISDDEGVSWDSEVTIESQFIIFFQTIGCNASSAEAIGAVWNGSIIVEVGLYFEEVASIAPTVAIPRNPATVFQIPAIV